MRNLVRSWAGVVFPPSSNCGKTVATVGDRFGCSPSSLGFSSSAEGAWNASSERRTEYICVASSRVGDIMIAPTWCFLRGSSRRKSFSMTGMRNASVFPLPVTAYTHQLYSEVRKNYLPQRQHPYFLRTMVLLKPVLASFVQSP